MKTLTDIHNLIEALKLNAHRFLPDVNPYYCEDGNATLYDGFISCIDNVVFELNNIHDATDTVGLYDIVTVSISQNDRVTDLNDLSDFADSDFSLTVDYRCTYGEGFGIIQALLAELNKQRFK